MLCQHCHVSNLGPCKDRLDEASCFFPLHSFGHEDTIPKDRSIDLSSHRRLTKCFNPSSMNVLMIYRIHNVYDLLILEPLLPRLTYASKVAIKSVKIAFRERRLPSFEKVILLITP